MNEWLFLFLHSFANRSLVSDWLIVFFAEYLPWVVIALAIIFLWVHTEKNERDKWKEIGVTMFTSISAYLAAIFIKILISADRPFRVLQDIAPLFVKEDYAFPSGHATFFGALAIAIFYKHRKVGAWFILAAVLIGLARIIAGAHFPSDILGGLILGALIAYFLKNV